MCLGIPGQVVSLCDERPLSGMVEVSGVRRKVNLECVLEGRTPEALVGEWVLVHVGFAMSVIDATEAAATLQALEELGEAMEAIEAIRATDAMLATEARP